MKLKINDICHSYNIYQHIGFVKRKKENRKVLNNISFEIESPAIVSILGSNGSGKSTLFKNILGVIKPTNGDVTLDGRKICKKDYYKISALFGQKSQLQWDLAVEDSFKILKVIYKIDDLEYYETLEYLQKTLNITEILNQPVRTLSLGQRMRCEFVAAFLHRPKLIILDEATIGIDVETKSKIDEMLIDYVKREKAIIIKATHDLYDLENVCDRVLILDQGSIVFDGVYKDLKNKIKLDRTVKITTKEKVDIVVQGNNYSGHEIIIDTVKPSKVVTEVLSLIDEDVIDDIDIQSVKVENIIEAIKND